MTDSSQWMLLLRTLLSLGAVIGFIYALAWFVKKYLRPEMWGSTTGSDIKILQTFAIDPKKKMMIIEVRGQNLLIGTTENSISLLCSLGSEKEGKSS
ncbi:MAG: Flagellar protein [Bacteriovoracaceae bacterium]|nr:Flagellar protein [Bacteriovoracaceae bacterium]